MGDRIQYPAPQMPKIAKLFGDCTIEEIETQLRALTRPQLEALASDRDLWGLGYQDPPPGDWHTWIMKFGRGGGKTHGGSEWINRMAEDKDALCGGDLALMGPTYSDTTKTMIRGPSGVLKTARPDFRPVLKTRDSSLILQWPNGVIAHVLSEDARERGRGLNLAGLWGDELAAWIKQEETFDYILGPAVRIGPALTVITTTPKPRSHLDEIEKRDGVIVTTGTTFDNPYLSPIARRKLIATYGGTRLEKQELFGISLGLSENALWTLEDIEGNRAATTGAGFPKGVDLARVVVAIDPAGTDGDDSDETGIIVAGIDYDGIVYILADCTIKAKPLGWAKRAVGAFRRWHADRFVPEINYGGQMVETTLRAVWQDAPIQMVRAKRGKATRAEPVSALTQQGKVKFCGVFPELEAQLVGWDPYDKKAKSPDRLDAMVYAVTELALSTDQISTIMSYL